MHTDPMRNLLPLAASLALLGTAAAAPPPDRDVAVAVVIAGAEVMMGNTEIEPPDSPARMPGLLPTLGTTFDLAGVASEVALVTYADRATVRTPLARGTRLAFGTQRDYYLAIGTDVVGGIEAGMAELARSRSARKYLVVIGDGNATDNEAAARLLPAMRTQLQRQGVVPIAIVYKSPLSADETVVTALDPAATRAMSGEEVGRAAVARLQAAEAAVPHAPATHGAWWRQLLAGTAGVLALASAAWAWRRLRG